MLQPNTFKKARRAVLAVYGILDGMFAGILAPHSKDMPFEDGFPGHAVAMIQ